MKIPNGQNGHIAQSRGKTVHFKRKEPVRFTIKARQKFRPVACTPVHAPEGLFTIKDIVEPPPSIQRDCPTLQWVTLEPPFQHQDKDIVVGSHWLEKA